MDMPRPGVSAGVKSPILQVTIREVPVPGADPDGVLPDPVIRMDDTEVGIKDDFEDYALDANRDFSGAVKIDTKTSFQRGLGQTTVWRINIGIKDERPSVVEHILDRAEKDGYKMDDAVFK